MIYNFTIAEVNTQISERFKVVFSSTSTLPLNFTSFSANQTGNIVLLKWAMNEKRNIKDFRAERSATGKNFLPVNSIKYSVNSGASFLALDEVPNPGLNFYRIKLTDETGKIVYSPIVRANLETSQLNIFPNPVKSRQFSLFIQQLPVANYQLRLIGVSGQVVYNANFPFTGMPIQLPVQIGNSIPGGMYTLVISGNNFQKGLKIVLEN